MRKLAVSNWYPYRHQATALEQLLGGTRFERIDLAQVSTSLHDVALGPFLALVEPNRQPIVGIQAIAEALHRERPELGLLPADAVERSRVRALADMIEERFSRHVFAAIAAHGEFGRKIWPKTSDAPEAILTIPPPLSSIEVQFDGVATRYLVGERPTLADCMLAATWWTIQDQGMHDHLAEHRWLSNWHDRNCHGEPFRRAA